MTTCGAANCQTFSLLPVDVAAPEQNDRTREHRRWGSFLTRPNARWLLCACACTAGLLGLAACAVTRKTDSHRFASQGLVSEFSSHSAGRVVHHGGHCLSVPRLRKGAKVRMWGCHGGWKRKRWNYVESSGHIRIGKKLCLSAPYPHKAGSPVHVAPCSGHALSRSWRYYKSGQIATRTTGLCLSSKHARVNGGHVYLWHCSPHSAPQRWHVHSGRATHGSFSSTPGAVHELYMYRAAPIGVMGKYPFGDINLGNLEGVMWYLNHEVATSSLPWLPTKFQPRCPRKFSIALIYRFKVKIKTTPAMVKKGLNFGTRFAYDAGKCSGRCFWNNMCTCGHDCAHQYHKYGYVPGCNNFLDHYPYPTPHTADQATEGIWYSLPEEGRCSHPTGSHTCTWSYEHAGVISVKDLEEQHPGGSNCCNGRCTYFWDHQLSTKRTKWRVKQALNLFHKKFPHEPKELHHSFCDFHHNRWYQSDPYPRQDGYTCPR